jgi:hypothetical protein
MSDRQLGPILMRPEIILGWMILAIVVVAPYWAVISYPQVMLTVGKIAIFWFVLCTPIWIPGLLRRR